MTTHLNNVYKSGELLKEKTYAKIAQVQTEGTRQDTIQIEFYNLDAILFVGYCVNSIQATQFRIWANILLKESLIEWFAINDERLKNLQMLFGKDYFEEQLARIRNIRSSKRRFYQKITDVYSQRSVYHEAGSDVTKKFFVTALYKLYWAIFRETAGEIIVSCVDDDKLNMELTTWKNASQ